LTETAGLINDARNSHVTVDTAADESSDGLSAAAGQ